MFTPKYKTRKKYTLNVARVAYGNESWRLLEVGALDDGYGLAEQAWRISVMPEAAHVATI